MNSESTPVDTSYSGHSTIDSLVTPYRMEMQEEMTQVIAYSKKSFTKGRPGGSLNNWAADAVLNQELSRKSKDEPVFCLLNVGGLRSSINEGNVTLGDLYKLMPFDNEIVWVKMPKTALIDVESYLKERNGEPIAGASLTNGKLKLDGWNSNTESFWIVTSDYLMNGGDKMFFFERRLDEEFSNVLMRDAMIAEATKQDTLIYTDELRISF